ERECKLYDEFDKFVYKKEETLHSGLIVPVFQKGDDPIDAINHMMSFLTAVVTSRYPTTNNHLRNSSNPRQQATINNGRVTLQPIQGRQTYLAAGTSRTYTPRATGNNFRKQRIVICYNYKEEGHMSKQYTKPKRKQDDSWFKDKVLLVQAQANGQILHEDELAFLADPRIIEAQATQTIITHNASYQADDLNAYDSDCDEINTAKVVLLANLFHYGSDDLDTDITRITRKEPKPDKNGHENGKSTQEPGFYHQKSTKVNLVELELRTIVEVAPMADNRTMEELLQAPMKGENASKMDDRIDKLADQISTLVDIFAKKVVTPATVKAVEESCVTCGGEFKNEIQNTMKTQQTVLMDQQNAFQNNLQNMLIGFFQNQALTLGTLPSNTISNPKGEMKAITTRSSVAYKGPSIPTNPKKVVDEKPRRQHKEQTNFQGSTAHIQPSAVPIPEPDVPNTLPKPNITYPSRLNDQKLRKKSTNQMEKFFQIIQDLHFDISFADALLLMPKFASAIKSLLANKDKLFNLSKIPLNENCSTMLLKKLPEKLGNLGKFLIPCDFSGMDVCHALAYLGTSINLMPLSIWKKISLPELTPTWMTLELADRSITRPKRVAKDVFVKVGKFYFPTEFVVVDFEVDPRVPLILGRSFLRAGRALIDVYREEITLRVNDEAVTFNLNQTTRYSSTYDDMSVNRIDFIDIVREEYAQEILGHQPSSKLGEIPLYGQRGNFPRYKISKNRLEVDRAKVHVIATLPHPTTVKGVRSFLGHAGFYRRFIQEFSKIARPMTHLLEKETLFVFSKDCIDAFETLKKKLTEAPILVFPDWNLPFELMCDASDFTIGAILGQRKTNHFQPIHYTSKTMTEAQIHYTATEKEMLAVVYAFKKFWPYLVLSKSIVYTDHSALKYLLSKQVAKPRLLRWVLLIHEFNIIIRGKKRMENLAADHLSRLENPHKDVLENKDINENFPLETLGKISSGVPHGLPTLQISMRGILSSKGCRPNKRRNSLRSLNVTFGTIPTFIGFMRIKSFDGVCMDKKLMIYSKLVMKDPSGAIMVPISLLRKYILVAIDYLSKWVEANALPSNDARVVVKFLKSLFARFGTLRAIISNHGTHFCNNKFAKVMSKYGVTHRLAATYHPQTNGQVEVSNHGLKCILERTIGENRASWSEKLEDDLWAFRIAYKTPIGCTPYKLVYGKSCHLPIE
nr:reverse transcriptase domain-containing protein [Tanacetum cinerariifolium]